MRQPRTTLIIALWFALALAACVAEPRAAVTPIGPTPPASPAPSTAAPLLTPAATTIANEPANEMPPPPGLVFRARGALWMVDAAGRTVRLLDHPDAVLSADGRRALYLQDGDIWLADLANHEERQVTRTVDRLEFLPRWVPEQPDQIVFSSIARDGNTMGSGYLTTTQLDGTGYRILDGQNIFYGPAAPSPDGETIAYGSSDKILTYRWDRGIQATDPKRYGIESLKGIKTGSPAWSTDGKRLAWVLGAGLNVGWRLWIGAVDLPTSTSQLMHVYEPAGVGGWPPAPAWSPDGKWLAFEAWARNADAAGVWLARADGSGTEQYLGPGTGPTWDPGGEYVAFTRAASAGQTGVYIAETGKWLPRRVKLPAGPQVVGWMEIKP